MNPPRATPEDSIAFLVASADTKNDHFRTMIRTAPARGLTPRCVLFDARYSGKENRKAVRGCGWPFLTQVRSNRRVNPDRTGNRSISECAIAASGTVVHLDGFGLVKAFWIVTWVRDSGVREVGVASVHDRGELVRGPAGHHSRRDPRVPRKPRVRATSDRNCVSPKLTFQHPGAAASSATP